jgi:hypothetical protein
MNDVRIFSKLPLGCKEEVGGPVHPRPAAHPVHCFNESNAAAGAAGVLGSERVTLARFNVWSVERFPQRSEANGGREIEAA